MVEIIIFDWKQTLYSPEESRLLDGAQEILDFLKNQEINLYLIGKGGDDMYSEVKRLGVKKYFKNVLFVDIKHPDHFNAQIGTKDYSKVLVIGDKLSSEIEVGNRVGARTIQVRQGKFAKDVPLNKTQKPDIIVKDLFELKLALRDILRK